MLSIYEYNNPAEFLRDAWLHKKSKNPAFSLRAWSKNLGFENNAPLSLMLSGKRPVPMKYVPLLIQSLGLTPNEGLYLEALLSLSKAKKVEQRNFYLERLRSLSPNSEVKIYEVENYKAIGNPLHAAILEMTELRDFKADPKWIKERVAIETSITETKEVIERLIGLGLLREEVGGKLTKVHRVLTNRADIADAGSQEYHKKVSQLAQQAITRQPVEQREFNGYAMNIKKSDLPAIKKTIRDFTKTFINTFASDETPCEETCQLNVQFFGLTKWEEK